MNKLKSSKVNESTQEAQALKGSIKTSAFSLKRLFLFAKAKKEAVMVSAFVLYYSVGTVSAAGPTGLAAKTNLLTSSFLNGTTLSWTKAGVQAFGLYWLIYGIYQLLSSGGSSKIKENIFMVVLGLVLIALGLNFENLLETMELCKGEGRDADCWGPPST